MASPTKQTRTIRRNKKVKRGQDRKRVYRNKGTTPKFPIHPEQGAASGESQA